MNNNVPQMYIPSEIRDQLLESLLDPKDLGQMKCVDKHWKELISSKPFVDAHLDRIKSQYRFAFIHKNEVASPPVTYLPEGYGEPVTRRFVRDNADDFEVLGTCNGLVLFCNTLDQFRLSNPSTNQTLVLPPVPDHFRPFLGEESAYFGVGYDVLHDDFWIIRVSHFFQLEGYISSVILYSRNSNSWSTLPPFPSQYPPIDNAFFVGGIFHWNVSRYDRQALVTFDCQARVYGEVEVPDFILGPWTYKYEGLDDNNLAVYVDRLTVDEFGVSRYFLQMHILNYSSDGRNWSSFNIFKEEDLPDEFALEPICYLNSSRTLLMFSVKPYGTFFSYDIATRQFRRMEGIESSPGCAKSYKYIESIVSPHPYVEV